MKHNLFKRVLSLALCLLMVVTAIPFSVSAATDIYDIAAGLEWRWPIDNHTVTQPFAKWYADRGAYHAGMDIKRYPDNNVSIHAIADGVVRKKVWNPNDTKANGNFITIEHKVNGESVYSFYAHMKDFNGCPEEGEFVSVGTKIGTMGSTGGSTGPHLHLGIYTGSISDSPWGYTYSSNIDANERGGRTYYNPQIIIENSKEAVKVEVNKNFPTNFNATAIGSKDHKIPVYTDRRGNYKVDTSKRHISGGDPCVIHEVYTTGMCSVTYPGRDGPVDGYYAEIENFNIGDFNYNVDKEGVTKSSITAKYLVYPEWIYPGTYYEAYSGAVTSNNPLQSVTVSITSIEKDIDTKIVKKWTENDDTPTRVVTFMENLPIKPEEFAKLKESSYIFRISASCNKKILWYEYESDEVILFESKLHVCKVDPEVNRPTSVTHRGGTRDNVVAIQAKTQNYNSANVVNTNNNYNGVSSYPIGTYKVKVNTSLNVRSGPGTNYTRVSSYKNGNTVNVTATNGNWGYTGIGWICLDYTTFVAYAETSYDSNISYGTGNYVVSTPAGLNCRIGAGTNSGLIKTLPHGTQFSVTQTDGAWGYSPEHGGWLCLQYASYVSALTPSLPVPALPNLSSTTSSEIGVGEVISFKWDAVDTAELYNVKLIDANTNKEVQQTTITGTNASFKLPYEGKFNVSVSASNSQHTGPAATLFGFYAKGPSTVTFKDWDGKVISSQAVAYGKDATVPTTPSRLGHTFTKWEGNYTEVRENQVVTATYTKNKYKVTFCDYDGTVISTQDVYYGDAATAPKYEAPTGYSFVKWDSSFNNITKATTVKAVISWTSLYPLEISTSSAVERNNKSYIVTSIVNNSPNAVSNARVIAVLKTKENKLLATVQSSNISLAKGEVKNLTLTASYEGMATKAEIFVVKADNENIPLAKQLVRDVNQGTAWSAWSTSAPPANALQTQSRTEYRYRDKQFTTSPNSTLNGWTLRNDVTNPTVSYGSWGGWSAWQDSYVSGSDVREVRTQNVTDYNNYTAWGGWSAWQDSWVGATDLREVQTQTVKVSDNIEKRYYYYRYAAADGKTGSDKQTGKYQYYEEIYVYSPLTKKGTYGNYGQGYYHTTSTGTHSFWPTDYLGVPCERNVVVSSEYKTQYRYRDRSYATKTQYSYRTRTKTTTYYFWKWGDWSAWSPTAVSGTSNRAVETRTTYRYLANTPSNIETTSGINRDPIKGKVDSTYANRQALLFISDKNGVAQYVGQTVIGANGEYNFGSYKLKDDPTAASGDYNVMLSIEGTSAAFALDPIKAPVPEYTVKFVDYDGTEISSQTVEQGKDASVPAPLSREGYRFIGWDKSFTNVQSNLTITAKYEIKSFDVVFIDEINNTSTLERYNYGDTLVAPEITANEAYNFLGWDAVLDGKTTVKENMVVTAKYELKKFKVEALGFEGEVVQSQTIDFGEPAILPELKDRDNYIFISWNIPGDINYVTEDITVTPYFEYTKTVAIPTANIETGTYNGEQTVTLSCETEGADIYYTLDGSDPLEEIENTRARSVQVRGTLYTGPFKIDSSAQLLFTAVKDGMNSSDYDYKTLAVNTSATETKQYTVTIHDTMYENEYTILVNEGSLVELGEELENYGYTLEGIYTDVEYKNAWNLETDTVNSETDLYLKWTINSYTVTFEDMNGNVIETQEVEFGEDAVAPTWEDVEGYIFTGWDADYTNIVDDITVTATYISKADVTTIEFANETLSLVEGQSETINATIKLGADCTNNAVIWQSSDENIAIVDDNGKVTAVAVGTATIFAVSEDSGMSDECVVTVSYKDPCASLGHDYKSSVTNPTCTEKGYTTHICSVCGNNYKDSEKAALGHNLGNFTVSIAPKCTSEGVETAKCTRCPYTETRTIKATGHVDKNNDGKCDSCNTKLESGKDCSCNCHKGGIAGFFFKIILFFQKLFRTNKICKCGVAHY